MECYLKDHPPKLKETVIPVCACKRIRVGGEWLKDPAGKLEATIEKNIRIPERIKVENVTVKTSDEGKHIKADIKIESSYAGQKIKKEFTEKIRKKIEVCPTCSKLAGRYYEAILQYRGEGDLELDAEEVSDARKVRGGADYYIMSLRYARSVANKLRRRGYTTGESHKIYGKREGKTVFRTSISLKPPPFSAGDIIEREGDAHIVTRIKETMETYNLSKGKPAALPLKSMTEFAKTGGPSSVHAAVVSAVTPSELQILDLATYKTHTIQKKKQKIGQGDEIKILVHEGECLIVPEHLL